MLCHTLNKKLKIIFRNYTTIGPGNISVAKNKAQRMIKTKQQSVKVDNYGSLCQYLANSRSKETNFYVNNSESIQISKCKQGL